MKIPFTLAPLATAEPANALLVPGNDAAALFDLVLGLGLDPLPTVHATAEGFLVLLPKPSTEGVPGVVRLRALAAHLFLPVTAELTPPLLADEAAALTRSRGLVFLPGQRCLSFAVDQPMAWNDLLLGPPLQPTHWQSLPEPLTLASELIELTSAAPPPLADELLEEGRSDIGTQSPRPEGAGSIGAQIVGTSLFAAGHIMAWLGVKLGLSGIAGKGADMLQKAFDKVPRLSEFLMNQQEAMLRRLLKDFREGRIEDALRRALPLGGNNLSGLAGNANLPTHNLAYSLANLLGNRHGPGGAWFTPDNLYYSLQAEYRKQAEQAARRGDFRRAAFIYAKLLGDMAGAARILAQGGLHRDAAIIYHEVLHNYRAAAQEWEAAGQIDKAIEILLDRLQDPLAAAEVYRRMGEDERALRLYRQAADKLIAQGKHFEAGELYRDKARRLDLALDTFAQGWKTRPLGTALPCGLALADQYSQKPDVARFQQLVAEANTCVPDWTAEWVSHCFNQIAKFSNRPGLATIAEKVQDHCLLALTAKMAQSGKNRMAKFFPADAPWPAPLVRDAYHAMGQVRQPETSRFNQVRLGRSTVRAVCHFRVAGELIVGLENGEILSYQMATGEVRHLAQLRGPIIGLQHEASENYLIVLCKISPTQAQVVVGEHGWKHEFTELLQLPFRSSAHLLPALDNHASNYFAVLADGDVHLLRVDNPSARQTITPSPGAVPSFGILGTFPTSPHPWVILFCGETLHFQWEQLWFSIELGQPLCPAYQSRTTLYGQPLAGWLCPDTTPGKWLATLRWLNMHGQIVQYAFGTDLFESGHRPVHFASANFQYGIHGCADRPFAREAISLWDHIDARYLQRNPIAAFSRSSDTAVVLSGDGTVQQVDVDLGTFRRR